MKMQSQTRQIAFTAAFSISASHGSGAGKSHRCLPAAFAAVIMVAGCTGSSGAPRADGSSAGRVVLYGGSNESPSALDDTWEWEGSAWRQFAPAATPGGRAEFGMASLGGKALLFGGWGGWDGPTPADTSPLWEWDGSAWTERTVSEPPYRSKCAMATLGGKVVLFGGGASGLLGDTWEWDGNNWTLRSTTGPSPRAHHAMATFGGKVVLFGGMALGSTPSSFGDTWEWDGDTWTLRSSTGPSPRDSTAMAALGDKLVLYSGVNGLSTDAPQDDTWEWDGGTWTQRSVTGPGARWAHTMATLGNKIVLFGGVDQSASHWLSDTWEWDGNVWTQRPVTGPGPRQDAGMVATLP